MGGLWNLFFGCWHEHTTFPFTSRRQNPAGGQRPGATWETYIVCLDCGQQFPYSWEQMKVLKARQPKPEGENAAANGMGGRLSHAPRTVTSEK